jgi:hypothetical protein
VLVCAYLTLDDVSVVTGVVTSVVTDTAT